MKSVSHLLVRPFGPNLQRCGLAAVTFFLLLAAQVFAQEATIVGTVTDPSGAAVPNASITVVNNDNGVTRTLPSSSDGQYVVHPVSDEPCRLER